ncbi:MAG: endonuclease/exonuclease/phosphatase family protein [Leptospirales bacterium]|nr:endonuclease/exonuclease/phosphatase family protein [Leptospirales bacterium]
MVTKILKWFGIVLGSIVVLFLGFVYFANYHPAELEQEAVVCPATAPTLKKGQNIKVLNWNVQYMAGKNYTFFYDVLDGSGKDTRPSSEDIAITIKEVARVINEEKPDILNLQELDEGSKRTDFADQLQLLLKLIPPEYACYSDAFYHKSAFVPHPSILGAVGMKLATISKFKMTAATRHQLALIPSNFVTQQFNLKRAVLEVQMPVEGDKDLVVLNTHLDAFSQGTNTMELQVAEVKEILEKATTNGSPWVMSGDFNLLPPGAYDLIRQDERAYYKPETELAGLYKEFQIVPTLDDTKPTNPNRARWFTHYPNGKRATGPDRTIDYVLYSPRLKLGPYAVRSADTLRISDHLPFRAEFKIP